MQHHSLPLLFPHLKSWSPCLLLLFLSLESSLALSPAWQSLYFLFWFCQFCEKPINLLEFLEEPTFVFLNFLHWFFFSSPFNSGLELFFFSPCLLVWENLHFFFENAINFTLETDLPVPSKFGVLILFLFSSFISHTLIMCCLISKRQIISSSVHAIGFQFMSICIHRTLLYTVKSVWIYWGKLSDPWCDLAWWLDIAHLSRVCILLVSNVAVYTHQPDWVL